MLGADIQVGMKLVACRPTEKWRWTVENAIAHPVEVIGPREVRDIHAAGPFRRYPSKAKAWLVAGEENSRHCEPLWPEVEGQYAITNAASWMRLEDAEALLVSMKAREDAAEKARQAQRAEEKRRGQVAGRAVDVLPSGVMVTDNGFRIDVDDAGFERIVTALRAHGVA